MIRYAMPIDSVPHRHSPPTILLRESYRKDGKVKKRPRVNLTNGPEQLVEGLGTLRRGGAGSGGGSRAIVAPAERSLTAKRMLASRRSDADRPGHSLRQLA